MLAMGTGLTGIFSGCSSTSFLRPATPAIPEVLPATPGINQLVSTIHRNTEAVRQLNSSVKVVMDGMPSASGTLLMERPDRLRLKVGILGMTDSGIDIGSNEEVFWFFNKSSFGGSRPTVFFANHHEYNRSAMQQSFQFRPQWLMDAMGLIQFDANETFDGPVQRDGNLELYATAVTQSGKIKRVLTIAPGSGLVLQLAVYDGSNRLLGWARSSKHRYFEEHNVSLPQHIKLTAVGANGQNVNLSVQVQSHSLNSLYVDPAITWAMPQPADVPVVDLARVNPATLQQSLTPGTRPASYRGGSDEFSNEPQASGRRPARLGLLKGFKLNR